MSIADIPSAATQSIRRTAAREDAAAAPDPDGRETKCAVSTGNAVKTNEIASRAAGKMDAFNAIYSRWMAARASIAGEIDDDAWNRGKDECEEAARLLLATPAPSQCALLYKLEVMESFAFENYRAGLDSDTRTVVAIAAIKADLMSFNF